MTDSRWPETGGESPLEATEDVTLEPDAGGPGRGEGAGEAKEVEGLSQNKIVWRKFVRHRGAMFGMITLALIAILSISSMGLGPIRGWWKWQDFNASHKIVNPAGAPTLVIPGINGDHFAWGDHPFGQDSIGADNFAQVMAGVKTSLFVMLSWAWSLSHRRRHRCARGPPRLAGHGADAVHRPGHHAARHRDRCGSGRLVFTIPQKYFQTTRSPTDQSRHADSLALALG